jgi:predicted TIM-barrel fold metal-dependent hydrolase
VLPGTGHMQVHPFVGFDPLAELRARRAGDIETPLGLVRDAVDRYGFVGVKVYPPMGWRPRGNRARPGLSAPDAGHLDDIVDEFAGWCAANDVPVTAHGADTVHAAPGYAGFGSPSDWRAVLSRNPGLRLNLGHFGGEADSGWPREIALATAEFPGLYADVGNHGLHHSAHADAYFTMLADLFADAATAQLSARLMYGSDWYMVAVQPEHQEFLSEYRRRYQDRFGADHTARFLAGNALAFLGFDDPGNANNRRLRERYRRFGRGDLPEWLAR